MPKISKRPPLPKGTVRRDVDIYTLEQVGGLNIISPERVYISMSDSEYRMAAGVDVGILCYARREPPNAPSGKNGYWVDEKSLKIKRRALVVGLLDKAYCSAWRQSTFSSHFRGVLKVVLWCDGNGLSDFLDSVEGAVDAYRAYSDYLHGQVVTSAMSKGGANQLQKKFQLVIEICFGIDAVLTASRGVVRINGERADIRAPEERHVKAYVDVLLGLIDSLRRQLMRGDPLPFKINMPDYSTYYFHSYGNHIKTPFYEPGFKIYNFEEGRIATVNEYIKKTDVRRSIAERAVGDANASLAECNADLNCEARKQAISTTLQAYAALFLLLTGANASQFVSLEYDEALSVAEGSVKKELTAVKFRARGKLVRFPVGGKQGLRLLRDYIEFRSWVLAGKEVPLLFFQYSRKGRYTDDFVRLPYAFQTRFFYKQIKGRYLPDSAINISATLGRKYKSVILHELKERPEIVASVMGHTLSVNAKSYSQASRSTQAHEFKAHWKAVRAAAARVRVMGDAGLAEKSTVSGHCEEKEAPMAIANDVPIQPNCKTEHGCLYCDKYTCHADEEDVQKLLSMRYVLMAVRELSDDGGHADSLFKDLCVRIGKILEAGEKTSSEANEMVARVRQGVDEYGRLTPFWAARMERYEAMGVVV